MFITHLSHFNSFLVVSIYYNIKLLIRQLSFINFLYIIVYTFINYLFLFLLIFFKKIRGNLPL
nr:MAG TPA: hypothetical protein [Caudoviricetes sp.]